jgi:hypothetical protein
MDREQFFAKLGALDEDRVKKVLWNLYWRGSAPMRERVHPACPGPRRSARIGGVDQPPDAVWVNDRVRPRRSPIAGDGLFATGDIAAGTVAIRLGGRLVGPAELAELIAVSTSGPGGTFVDTVTVHENAHLVLPAGSVAHLGNHSCDPNLWFVGPYEIAARRNIGAGDELTVDYGTCSAASGFTLSCNCRSRLCRHEITSEDWRRPELQQRYGMHWVPALRARIDCS